MIKGIRRGALALGMAVTLPLALWSCGKPEGGAPALSKKTAAVTPQLPGFASSASPGVVPCGSAACPVTKSARRVCCNAPGVPPMCRSADRCGQASKFRYSGMLSCNETADCKGSEPGRDVVCCITDDGFRAEGVPGPYNRAGCVPRAACGGKDVLACTSDGECPKGTHCRSIAMGSGVEIGGCLP
jgi:hypothetical protein